jgi:hypothetical protein
MNTVKTPSVSATHGVRRHTTMTILSEHDTGEPSLPGQVKVGRF